MIHNLAVYTAFGQANVTAASGAGDLMSVVSPADALVIPLEAWAQKDTDEASEQVVCKLSYRATAGLGGTIVTPTLAHSHLIASQCTVRRNDTTDASGTERIVAQKGTNLIANGFEWTWDEICRVGRISESLVLYLADALAADSDLSFGITWAELGQ